MPTNDLPAAEALTPIQTFAKSLTVGEGKATMPLSRSFVMAMLAGFYIGLGGMFMVLVKSDATLSLAASAMLGGFAFSVGLFAVLVAGAELFTGNNLMLLGCLEGRYSASSLLRSWAVVYAGNLVGSLLIAFLLAGANFAGMNGGAVGQTAIAIASAKCSLPIGVAFFRGIMCNVLVCLAVWMGFASRSVIDKFVVAAMPVMTFVACGFEHCVANMFLLPFGLLVGGAGDITLAGICANIAVVTLGNVVGGALLFGGAYWVAFGRKRS